MISTNGGAFARLVAGGAAAATALAGFTIGLAAPAHAAVTISGSTRRRGGQLRPRAQVYAYGDARTARRYAYELRGQTALSTSRSRTAPTSSSSTASTHVRRVLPRQGRRRVRRRHHRRGCGPGPAPPGPSTPSLRHRHDHRAVGRPVSSGQRPGVRRRDRQPGRRGLHRLHGRLPHQLHLRRSSCASAATTRRTGDQLASEFYMDKGTSRPPTRSPRRRPAPTSAPWSWPPAAHRRPGHQRGRRPVHRARSCSDLGGCDCTDANGDYLIEGVDHRRSTCLVQRPDRRLRSASTTTTCRSTTRPVRHPRRRGPGQAVTTSTPPWRRSSRRRPRRRRPQRHRPRRAR